MLQKQLKQIASLVEWTFLGNRHLFILCGAVQFLMTLALVYGYSLVMGEVSLEEKLYLGAGAITMGLISLGCTMAAQEVTGNRLDGMVEYLRTLPVPRITLVLADLVIWILASLPGIFLSLLVVYSKFQILPQNWLLVIPILDMVLVTMLLLGFSLAYSAPPSLTALVNQLVLMVGLLFSPILYPPSRLPEWIVSIYNYLPFVPAGNLVRNSLFQGQSVNIVDLGLLLFWSLLALSASLYQLERRD